ARILDADLLHDQNAAVLLAIVLSSICYAFYHLSDLENINPETDGMVIMNFLASHFWKGICFGALFWMYGFSSAVICHIVVELIAGFINKYVYVSVISSVRPSHR
ncbi:MAG TPA: CPBP family glutamic-type intramembrane protease, partial [Methanosarcina sp.]|nr:CPBP family glutamic-type intramembrane protease [Methanosarcina sp.]